MNMEPAPKKHQVGNKFLTDLDVNDNYFTTKEIWEQVVPFLPRDVVYWEAFYGKLSGGLSGKILADLGLRVIHDDVDFFEYNLGDIIISNPPFSKKREILDRLWLLQKPWVLLLPSHVLATQYLRRFKDKLGVIIPRRRMQFLDSKMQPTDKACFDTYFVCWDIPGMNNRIVWL